MFGLYYNVEKSIGWVKSMQKKKLIEQNLLLFEQLEKSQGELEKLKRLLNKNAEEISILKALLGEAQEEDKAVITEPIRRLEEKVIANAALKPDMEYGSVVIGKIVLAAAEHSNKLTMGGDDTKKELVNLILGRTEVAKAEVLSVIESDDSLEIKCDKIDDIASAAKEYFESVVAQIV